MVAFGHTVRAAVRSLFGSSGDPVSILKEPSLTHVQTMGILQPAINWDPNPAKGGGDVVVVDEVALMPDAGPVGTMVEISHESQSDQISTYVVREGDSLGVIAEMFDVSVNTIRWANDLKPGTAIREGQTLVILPVSGVRHTVVKGDTVASIAKRYGADAAEIASFNNIESSHTLTAGKVVIVPDGEIKSTVAPRRGSSTAVNVSGYFMRPVQGALKTQGLHGYNGIDLGAPAGTPVIAAAAGEVIVSRSGGWNGGYGNYIVIKHSNGTQTLYAHLLENGVGQGEQVAQGQAIGSVGNSGRATGYHLHFEVRGATNPF